MEDVKKDKERADVPLRRERNISKKTMVEKLDVFGLLFYIFPASFPHFIGRKGEL